MDDASSSKRKRTTDEDSDTEAPDEKKLRWPCPTPSFTTPSEMVTFYIGEEGQEEKFQVHKEFACAYSPVLKTAFSSAFIEGQTQTYRLQDISPDAFRMLVNWFYTQNLVIHKHSDAPDEDFAEVERLVSEQDMNLIQIWLIADRLLIPRLQNIIANDISSTWSIFRFTNSVPWMAYAYEHTNPDSPLRHLVVDCCIYKIKDVVSAEHQDEMPRELLLDIFRQVALTVVQVPPIDPARINVSVPSYVAHERAFGITRTPKSFLVKEEDAPDTCRLVVKELYTQDILVDIPLYYGDEDEDVAINREGEQSENTSSDDLEMPPPLLDYDVLEGLLTGDAKDLQEFHLIQLWITAEELGFPALQNMVLEKINVLWGAHSSISTTAWLAYLYKNTSGKSPLRELMVDRFGYSLRKSSALKVSRDMPHQFLVDMFAMFSDGIIKGSGVLADDGGSA
ncbi:hypothetical protein VTL71DRAFT_16436 [Oculimacula yallundae]|uniref:BTB domain-containing protein n=1 Tax=Oculimacula yallundae TaxID=86028 RepID=A0ABR4CEK5_9HELO